MTKQKQTRRAALATFASFAIAGGGASTLAAQTPPPAPRSRLAATALYNSLTEWGKVRQALARTNGIQDVRIDAISIDGALLALLYVGTLENLRLELRRRGLVLSTEEIGPTIRLAAGP